jgi:hypothetical protein
MNELLLVSPSIIADASTAMNVTQHYVTPTMRILSTLAGIVCTVFIIIAGYLYMTSSGRPEKLDQAKRVLRSALIGLLIVLSAATLTAILSHAYGQPVNGETASLPILTSVQPKLPSSGLVEVLIKAITGFLNVILQAVGAPFLAALDYFTKSTPLMANNPSVFNLWLAIVGIADGLFVIVLALIGFHVMSATSLGFDEIEIKHLLPRIGLVFLLLNCSIFLIDGIIALSNVLIAALGQVTGGSSPWKSLTAVVETTSSQGLAALLLMLAFLIFTVMLLVYYVGRLVTLFIGAVLSPLVILVWLVPGFRDFSESAMKTYISTMFVLFVHVVILQLSASLFAGIAADGTQAPEVLMAMVVGLATVVTLLKTQSVMMQFSYVSMGARNARKLGGQFINGVSYLSGKTSRSAGGIRRGVAMGHARSPTQRQVSSTPPARKIHYDHPRKDSTGVVITRRQSGMAPLTTGASAPTSRSLTVTHTALIPKNNAKEKIT